MSYSQQNSHKRRKHAPRSDSGDVSFFDLMKNGAVGAGFALASVIVLSLVSSALCLLYSDPSALTMYAGIAILYISSIAGGVISAIKFRGDKSAAIVSGILCGFIILVSFGIISTFLSLAGGDFSHSVKLIPSILLRALCIPASILGAYMGSRKKSPRRKRRK